MSADMVRPTEFGKDFGLVHEAVVTGRNVGAGREFWAKLAHDKELFRATERFVREGGWLKPVVASVPSAKLVDALPDIEALKAEWQAFWKGQGIECDLSDLKVPTYRPGFARLLVIPKGVTAQSLFQMCEKMFRCWKYTDGDLKVKSDRYPSNGTYAIWIRDRVEADEEYKSKSVDDIKKLGVAGITLEERFVLGMKYYQETGKHLDVTTTTLCAGSRDGTGSVPSVYFFADEVFVSCCSPGCYVVNLRVREVVFAAA